MIPTMLLAVVSVTACSVVEVHDGDSIRCNGERVRISGIDAPELPDSPRCDPRQLRTGPNPSWCDFDLGFRSRDALRAFVARGEVVIRREGQDRYGRTLAMLTVHDRDAGEYLIKLGLARRWEK
jgi:micrococcal nuclease